MPDNSDSVNSAKRTGGIDLSAQGGAKIDGDVVGRDKIVQATPSQLPPKSSFLFLDRHKYNYPFVGRNELIKQLPTALSQVEDIEVRPVVLLGLGGTGKTRSLLNMHNFSGGVTQMGCTG